MEEDGGDMEDLKGELEEIQEKANSLEEINENMKFIKSWVQEYDKKGLELMTNNLTNMEVNQLKQHQTAIKKQALVGNQSTSVSEFKVNTLQI